VLSETIRAAKIGWRGTIIAALIATIPATIVSVVVVRWQIEAAADQAVREQRVQVYENLIKKVEAYNAALSTAWSVSDTESDDATTVEWEKAYNDLAATNNLMYLYASDKISMLVEREVETAFRVRVVHQAATGQDMSQEVPVIDLAPLLEQMKEEIGNG